MPAAKLWREDDGAWVFDFIDGSNEDNLLRAYSWASMSGQPVIFIINGVRVSIAPPGETPERPVTNLGLQATAAMTRAGL